MSRANWQAVGTSAAGTSGGVTPTIPTHAIGDLLLLIAEGHNTDFGTDPSGWTVLYEGSGVNSKLKVWWKLAVATNTTNPTITPTAGDHTYAIVHTFRNVNTLLPFRILGCSNWPGAAAATACSIAGGENPFDLGLYFGIAASSADVATAQFSAESNADVTSLTERSDEGTALGGGGGIVCYSGDIAAGKVRSTTMTSATACGITSLALVVCPIADHSITNEDVTVAGAGVGDGGNVRMFDITQPAASALCATVTTSGGKYTALVPYTDHYYQAVFENGTNFGASSKALAS